MCLSINIFWALVFQVNAFASDAGSHVPAMAESQSQVVVAESGAKSAEVDTTQKKRAENEWLEEPSDQDHSEDAQDIIEAESADKSEEKLDGKNEGEENWDDDNWDDDKDEENWDDDDWDDDGWADDDWSDDDWDEEDAITNDQDQDQDQENHGGEEQKESDASAWDQLEFSAEIAPELKWFAHRGLQDQHQFHSAIRVEPELFYRFNEKQDSLLVQLFWRQDYHDNHRTHGDIRELVYTHAQNNWELKAGISKVFWGVAETRHLIDIVNQTDLVENFDGEDKLGQPMIRFSYHSGFGTFDIYALPFFRERTFSGEKGRLRSEPVVDIDRPLYESSAAHLHKDWALRWFHTIGVWDIGLNFFRGTSREPRFLVQYLNNDVLLIPFYDIIQQYSTDIQATIGDWLWKFEGFVRQGQGPTFNALVGGFEYTRVGVFDSKVDFGWLLEYHHDNRDPRISFTSFNNDLAAGLRVAFNDEHSTELLLFGIIDRHLSSRIYRLEASRRLTDHLTASLEGAIFSNINTFDPLTFFRRDKFIQLELIYYL